MTFPSSNSTSSLGVILSTLQALAGQTKSQAQNSLTLLQTQNVDTIFVFQLLDRLIHIISTLNAWRNTTGLDAYATSELPGYAGTLTADINGIISAAQACINWTVTNFPKDSTQTYILAESLNSDGTRTLRQFTPAQTAGLQTLIQALIATIG